MKKGRAPIKGRSVRAWVEKNLSKIEPDRGYAGLYDIYCASRIPEHLKASSSHFGKICKQVEQAKEERQLAEAKKATETEKQNRIKGAQTRQHVLRKKAEQKAAQSVPTSVPQVPTPLLKELQDENAFLLWWNLSERKGYIDRLLARMAADKGSDDFGSGW